MDISKEVDPEFCCKVCGLEHEEKPWGEDGESPTFFICPCCGVEFGYEDCLRSAAIKFRKHWLGEGGKWWKKKLEPKDWYLEEQMKNIPEEFI